MSIRMLFAAMAVCFAFPATAATVKFYDVFATLTHHNVFCGDPDFCAAPEPGVYFGMEMNKTVTARLEVIGDTSSSGYWEFYLSHPTGGIGDTSENVYGDFYASLSWNGETGEIQSSFDHYVNGWYESANIDISAYIAPVPLPASGAILPAGIAALVWFRKRRKKG